MQGECKVIGTVAEFGNWQIFKDIAKAGSDPAYADIVDSCDIYAYYGTIVLTEETIVSLFRDSNKKLLPNIKPTTEI